MKRIAGVIIYIFILLLGQVLFASVSFAEDGCDPSSGMSCPDAESTPSAPSGGSGGGISSDASTAVKINPGIDQRCWIKEECVLNGGQFVGPNVETITACKMEKDAANKLIGFCLPGTKVETALDWGGSESAPKKTFIHIGEFIQWIYKYGIAAAGILAVVMIITAGFSWAISGGNQERVTAAKKKIGNALMGLFLAVMAYFILNLINPYLVNFRLPNIWMINTANIVPPYCDDIKSKNFALAKETASKEFQNTYAKAQQSGFSAYDVIKPACGSDYFVEGSGGLTCSGTACNGGVCLPKEGVFACEPGMLGGSLGAPPSLMCITAGSDLTSNIVDNNIMLIAMCKNGELKIAADESDLPDSAREYVFPVKNNLDSICGEEENLAGFYIGAEINNEGDGLGTFCPGIWSSWGCDDWHAIGKSSPHSCDLNLAKAMTNKIQASKGVGTTCNGQFVTGADYCACGALSSKLNVQFFVNDPALIQSLISLDELKGGYYCNIEISRSEFPAGDHYIKALYMCAKPDPTWCFTDQ